MEFRVDGALDDDDDLVCVFGVLCEVGLDNAHAVDAGVLVVGVEVGAGPEAHAIVKGGFHDGDGFFFSRDLFAPCQACSRWLMLFFERS